MLGLLCTILVYAMAGDSSMVRSASQCCQARDGKISSYIGGMHSGRCENGGRILLLELHHGVTGTGSVRLCTLVLHGHMSLLHHVCRCFSAHAFMVGSHSRSLFVAIRLHEKVHRTTQPLWPQCAGTCALTEVLESRGSMHVGIFA